jgi:hypothetical protein
MTSPTPISPVLPTIANPSLDVWGESLNGDLTTIVNALNLVISSYAPVAWVAATVVASGPVTGGQAVRVSTASGAVTVTLTPSGSSPARTRIKWVAGSTGPVVVAAGGTVLDPTWSGFGQLGDSADFSLDTTQSPAVWQLV